MSSIHRCRICGDNNPLYNRARLRYECVTCDNTWTIPRVIPGPTLPDHLLDTPLRHAYACDTCGTPEPTYDKALREYLCTACTATWPEPRVIPGPTLPAHLLGPTNPKDTP